MREAYLGLAIHNHQPVGNFPWVFQQAYEKAYLPFLEALERHPTVRLSLHYSGPVLDWIVEHEPVFLNRLRGLVARGQVELMTGGYYEPILPIIPDEDKLGQIQKLTCFIQERLHTTPTGLWLAERVWEPHLPRPLAQAGVEWTVVDDTHFHLSGLRDDQLLGYYVTEEQGSPLKIFPSSKRLRYLIPWREVEEVMEHLKSLATETGPPIAVMGDDGEKFGIWPKTYKHCWEKGWMEQFLVALEDNASWLHTIPLGEYARQFPPLGRVYLPTASYDEMMEWALPPEASRELTHLRHELEAQGWQEVNRYLRGGFWRNFLAKYPEADTLHKKMLRVQGKVHRALEQGVVDAGLEELWRGQCNCPYWHGVFGGLYLNDVRSANYHYLILAENKADASRDQEWLQVEEADFDLDGRGELLVEGKAQCLYLDPAQGGGIFLWDLRRQAHNLQGTVARRPEAYHTMVSAETASKEGVHTIHEAVLVKDPTIPSHIPYDWHPRWSLLEHFLAPQVRLEEYAQARYHDLGDFTLNPFQARFQEQGEGLCLHLERMGSLDGTSLRLVKELFIPRGQAGLEVSYELTSQAERPIASIFVSEWNLNLLGGGKNPAAYYQISGRKPQDRALDSQGELEGVKELALVNEALGIRLTLKLELPGRLWCFPVESVSSSEGGLERVYQASCLALLYPVELARGKPFRLRLVWKVS